MSDLCAEWECGVCGGWNVCLIWLLGDSATQPLLEMCDLPWLICVSEAQPASSACFRKELFWVWQCSNHSHAQLCQYRLELQSAGSQILTSPHALKLLPAEPVSGDACAFRASLSAGAGNYPLLEWLWEPGCKRIIQVMEIFLKTTFACSSAFCIKQYSINVLLFFTEALLFFACEQHFTLRILKCSINSDNSEDLYPSHREFHLVTRCLVTDTEQWVICCFLQ